MACYSLKCLKLLVFFLAVFIMVFAGLGPIIFGAVYYNDQLATALELQAEILGLCLGLGIMVILFSIMGIYGACKVKRYCLCWYLIFLIIVFLFTIGLLAFFIALVVQGEEQLKNYCNNRSTNRNYSAFKKLESYDDIIRNLGTDGHLCGSDCLCALPASPFDYKYSRYDDLPNVMTSRTIIAGGNGKKKTQECSFFNSKYGKTRRALIEVMGEVERQFDCVGICFTSNLSVAHDSTETIYQSHFDNQQGSCLKKLVDYADDRWASGIGFFTAMCIVVLLTMIYTCCICNHKEVRYWEKDESNQQ